MVSTLLEKLRADAAMRPQTDTQVSTAWTLVPIAYVVYLVALIFYAVISIFAMFGCFLSQPPGALPSQSSCLSNFTGLFGATNYFQIISFVLGCGYAYVVFLLVRRRNTHFVRLQRLKKDLVAALRETERSRGIDVEADLVQAELIIHESDQNEGEKSAMLFSLLVLLYGLPYVGIVGIIVLLYVFTFLQQDWWHHDEREDRFFGWVQHASYQLGVPFNLVRTRSMPKRSAALYIIGAIFTVGIFEIYWVYTLINDSRDYLKDHAQFEDGLVAALSAAPAASPQ